MSRQTPAIAVITLAAALATQSLLGSPAEAAEAPPVRPLVEAVGGAKYFGDPSGLALQGALVSIQGTPTGAGYWIAGSDGGVFAYGDAPWLGSIPQVLPAGVDLDEPIVELIAHSSGSGYWLIAGDGGVFAYGEAPWLGSIPQVLAQGVRLAAPISAAAAHPDGNGYWLLGSDGGVFTFGSARYHGSVPQLAPDGDADAVAIVASPSGNGYTIHLRNGVVMSFGDAPSFAVEAAPVADADWTPIASASATVNGETTGSVELSTDAGTGIAGVAIASGGGAWVMHNSVGPVVSVWQSGGLSANSLSAALDAAASSGSQSTVSHGGAIDYLSTQRRGVVVDAAPAGWRIAMSAIALDPHRADVLVGGPATRALSRGELVVGRLAANRHGIRRGDVVELYGWNRQTRFITVGHIGETIEVGNVEIVMALATASELGFDRSTAVLIWGFSQLALESELDSLPNERWLTVNRSWEPTGRDAVLSTSRLKDLAGEPAYLPGGRGDPVIFQRSWIDEHIVAFELPILGSLRCHVAVGNALIAVFGQIEAEGLAAEIDVVDTRSHGGCFFPRVIRGSSGGALSRHSWGVAIDVNPATNAFGTPPTINGRIVEIFRSHGFAWGGSWVRQDGMHFEWTGQ